MDTTHVIFKDESLMTIRFLYFHYMTSVFQLHLLVNSNQQHINASRAHFLSSVLQKSATEF
jgi:hypothetical protein